MMADHCDEGVMALVGTIAWRLWGNQNEIRNGGKRIGELELLHGASLWLLEYQEATADVPKQFDSLVQCWLPPSSHLYKANVDGAVFKAQRESRVGVIIRDANGLVVAALSKKFHAPLGPLEVEAKAFEAGLQFSKDMGLQEFILEGDSLNVVHALEGLSPLVFVMPIIYGIQSSCHDVRNELFSHVCIWGNKPAHLLAKHVINIVDFSIWMEENSCFLEQALYQDVMFSSV